MKKLLALATLAAAAFAAEGYKVLDKIKIGGSGGWDYALYDSATDRIFVSHASQVEVIDAKAGKLLKTIPDTPGVHGFALVPEFNRGFITSRGRNAAIMFDLKTLEKTGEVKTGANPDAVCYDPQSKRVVTMNHSGNSATAIDAKSGQAIATFDLGPAPEFCAVDDTGKIYVNLEDSSELVEIDAAKPAVARRMSLEPACKGPTGLAIDTKDHLLFSVCGGTKTMAIVDYTAMKLIGTAPIGTGPDGAGYDPGAGLAFSSNGQGTLTIVKNVGGKWQTVDTVETARGARTMTIDPKSHRIYLPTAEYGAATPRPDTFHLVVVGRQ